MKLNWKGKEVLSKVERAAALGINATMAQAVEHAKRNHEWVNRSTTLEGSIAIAKYAQKRRRRIVGLWGSRDVKYALVHELGSAKKNIRPRPYLRPAADANYPNLARNIKRAMRR